MNLANAAFTRFAHTGSIGELCDAVALRVLGHPKRSSSLMKRHFHPISTYLKMDDLEETIKYLQDALAQRPLGHPKGHTMLIDLATAVVA
jgi:hypothetical protein